LDISKKERGLEAGSAVRTDGKKREGDELRDSLFQERLTDNFLFPKSMGKERGERGKREVRIQ